MKTSPDIDDIKVINVNGIVLPNNQGSWNVGISYIYVKYVAFLTARHFAVGARLAAGIDFVANFNVYEPAL